MDLKIILIVVAVFCVIGAMLSIVIEGVPLMAKNISIQKILNVLLQRLKFIILSTLVVGLLFFLYSKIVITPMYATSAMIYIQNYNASNADNNQNSINANGEVSEGSNKQAQKIYNSDISGSANLANICVNLFQNSDEVTALYDGCQVNISVTKDTFFITISVDGTDPEKCATVANNIAETAQTVFHDHFDYGQIGTIRSAKVPSGPYGPDNFKNMLIGLAVGLAASCLISILLELIDTTVKPDDDLQQMYDLPVFSEIPNFDPQNR